MPLKLVLPTKEEADVARGKGMREWATMGTEYDACHLIIIGYEHKVQGPLGLGVTTHQQNCSAIVDIFEDFSEFKVHKLDEDVIKSGKGFWEWHQDFLRSHTSDEPILIIYYINGHAYEHVDDEFMMKFGKGQREINLEKLILSLNDSNADGIFICDTYMQVRHKKPWTRKKGNTEICALQSQPLGSNNKPIEDKSLSMRLLLTLYRLLHQPETCSHTVPFSLAEMLKDDRELRSSFIPRPFLNVKRKNGARRICIDVAKLKNNRKLVFKSYPVRPLYDHKLVYTSGTDFLVNPDHKAPGVHKLNAAHFEDDSEDEGIVGDVEMVDAGKVVQTPTDDPEQDPEDILFMT